MDKAVTAPQLSNRTGAPPVSHPRPSSPSAATPSFSATPIQNTFPTIRAESILVDLASAECFGSEVAQSMESLAAVVRDQKTWTTRFPASYRKDIDFLLHHPSGQNLTTHLCMGVAHTNTFRTADHTRVAPHTLLAAELAMEMAQRLNLNDTDTADIVIAVAAHDQGHIFASHQSETAINSLPEFDGSPGKPKFCHEVRTRELLSSPDFIRHFGTPRLERLKSILYDNKNPLHLIVDWSDRLAYLIADSIHLGIEELVQSTSVRREFIQSLELLPDGTIGFNSLGPVARLIAARDMLYRDVSEGATSTLFKGFLVEAYQRAIEHHGTTPTEFVRQIAELSTPSARRLFTPQDQPRLYCPQQDGSLAQPVDLDYTPCLHVTLDMLSAKGREAALNRPFVGPKESVPACLKPRAGMSEIEHAIRSHFSAFGGSGYLERTGCIVGVAHMAAKSYPLKQLLPTGEIEAVQLSGSKHWELFIAIPKNLQSSAHMLHRLACEALENHGYIDSSTSGPDSPLARLKSLPPQDLFTRG